MIKVSLLKCLVCLLAVSVFSEETKDYRTFTDLKGRVIEARILEFDASKNRILIQRSDGNKAWVFPKFFSEGDQEYIRAWAKANRILSPNNLWVSVQKQRIKNEDGFSYQLVLKNQTDDPISDLHIDYLIYIKVTGMSLNRGREYVYYSSGNFAIDSLLPHQKDARSIPARHYIELDKDERTQVSKHMTVGIWVKVHAPSNSGMPVVRNVCHPATLQEEEAWVEPSKRYIQGMKNRGPAWSTLDLNRSIKRQLILLNGVDDERTWREFSQGLDLLYSPSMDRGGWNALLIVPSFYHKGCYDLAIHWLEKAAQSIGKHKSLTHIMLSDLYSSAPQPAVWNGEKAIKYAKLAQKQGPPANPLYSDLLAAAYARNGQFDLAVQEQKKALAFLSQSGDESKKCYVASYKKRLALYEKEKPYVTEPEDPKGYVYNAFVVGEKPIFPGLTPTNAPSPWIQIDQRYVRPPLW